VKRARCNLYLKAAWCYGSASEREDLEKLTQKDGQNLQARLEEEREKFKKDETFSLFSTVYFISKQDFILADGDDLLRFLTLYTVKTSDRYRNIHAMKEAIRHISSSIKARI